MVITNKQQDARVVSQTAGDSLASVEIERISNQTVARLTTEMVWRALAKATFAVISYVTPAGLPRSSGVVYAVVERRLYLATAPDSWKAKQIALSGQVAVTVPVRRGGLLSLVFPIPPATISFHAAAIVHPAGSADSDALSEARQGLAPMLPAERQASSTFIEIIPEGNFLTFGLGVPLLQMRSSAALARVTVG